MLILFGNRYAAIEVYANGVFIYDQPRPAEGLEYALHCAGVPVIKTPVHPTIVDAAYDRKTDTASVKYDSVSLYAHNSMQNEWIRRLRRAGFL